MWYFYLICYRFNVLLFRFKNDIAYYDFSELYDNKGGIVF